MSNSSKSIERLNTLKPWNGVADFGLTAIRSVLKKLGDPQERVPVIHVAGTNGKGSVVAFISQILQEQGGVVGRFTSPHLETVNERICLNEFSISDPELEVTLGEVFEVVDILGVSLSYFEAITAAAFHYFSVEMVDFAVIEVGLGGRLDATNVVAKPKVCVITSIGLDHERILGESKREIAREKAGIIKAGVPVVLGRMESEVEGEIGQIAESLGSQCLRFGRDFYLDDQKFISDHDVIPLKPSLLGEHQLVNSAVAAAASRAIGVSTESIMRGISSTHWPGRLERIQVQGKEILIDCAHNVDGMRVLVDFLRSNDYRDLTCILGFLDTKRWQEMVDLLAPYVSNAFILRPDSNRALDPELVRDFIHERYSASVNVTSIHEAEYDKLVQRVLTVSESPTILLTGSIYLISRLRTVFLSSSDGEVEALVG